MKLKDIQEEIATENKISKAAAGRIINKLLAGITTTLATEGRFRLGNVGVLKVKARGERTCCNPQTRALVVIPARNAPTFTASKHLKQAVNQK